MAGVVTTVAGDLRVTGAVRCDSVVAATKYQDADIADSAGIQASKLEHHYEVVYRQPSLTTAAAGREVVHVVRGTTGTLLSIRASAVVKMTNGGSDDKAFTVDLYKNGVSVMTSVITANKSNLTANYLLLSGSISSTTLAADDVLEVVVAVSGSTGTQATGVFVVVKLKEDAA